MNKYRARRHGCNVSCAMDHLVRFTRPSHSNFAHCKQSKTGRPGNEDSFHLRLMVTSK